MCGRAFRKADFRDQVIAAGMHAANIIATEGIVKPGDIISTFNSTSDALNVTWGYPMEDGGLVYNAREDKLKYSNWWKERATTRVLIPVSSFDEKGKQFWTNGITWLAGVTDGHNAAILTMNAMGAVKAVHHRMPVVLTPERMHRWLEKGHINTVTDLRHT